MYEVSSLKISSQNLRENSETPKEAKEKLQGKGAVFKNYLE